MGINSTLAEREKQADQDYLNKLKLEKPLVSGFSALFRNMSADIEAYVSIEGVLPDVTVYDAQIVGMLSESWAKTSKAFSGNLIDKIDESKPTDNKKLEAAIAAAALFYGLSRSEFITQMKNRVTIERASIVKNGATSNAAFISQTNVTQADVAIVKARQKLIESGAQITNSMLAKETASNFKTLAMGRVETIAITNVQGAAEETKNSEADIVADSVKLDMKKQWLTRGDDRVRPAHVEADYQLVLQEEPYIVDGEQLMYPKDTSLGASVGNVINCLHPDTVLTMATPQALTRRAFDGEVFTIKSASGNEITVTANHPILTSSGWKAASLINKGDSVISASSPIGSAFRRLIKCFYVENIIPTVEQVFNASQQSGHSVRVPSVGVNFHGEITNSDVEVIYTNSKLRNRVKSFGFDGIHKLNLTSTNLRQADGFGNCLLFCILFMKAARLCSDGLVSFFSKFLPIFKGSLAHAEIHGVTAASCLNPVVSKASVDNRAASTKLYSKAFNRSALSKLTGDITANLRSSSDRVSFRDYTAAKGFFSGGGQSSENSSVGTAKLFSNYSYSNFFVKVAADNVVDVKVSHFVGHVYNLEDKKGFYSANGIVAHNCRCSSIPYLDDI